MDLEPMMGGDTRVPTFVSFHHVRGWFVAAGVGLVALGILAIALPQLFTFGFDAILGLLLIAGAVVHGVHAFQQRRWTGTLLRLIVAALYLAAGVFILIRPRTGVLALTLILCAFLFAAGASRLVLAYHLSRHPGWVWTLVSGLLSILLGGLLFLGWPSTAAWAIGLLVGVDLLFAGWSLIGLTIATRMPARYS
jgi:uncharacterized membrane protein HdeD (DUF308 family)